MTLHEVGKSEIHQKHVSNFLPKSPRLYCKELALDVVRCARCVMVLIKGRCDDSLHTVMKSLVTSGPSHHMLLSIHWSVTRWYYPDGKAFSLCAAHHMPEIREGSAAGHAGCTHTLEGSPKV